MSYKCTCALTNKSFGKYGRCVYCQLEAKQIVIDKWMNEVRGIESKLQTAIDALEKCSKTWEIGEVMDIINEALEKIKGTKGD